MSTVRIDLSAFLLRDFEETDRVAFISYQTDPRYAALYDFDPFDTGRAEDLFDLFQAWRRSQPRSNFQLGLFELRTDKLCGCAGLRRLDGDEAMLGIELAPGEWGRFGLALDAAAALLAFGFETLGLRRVVGDTASGNRRIEKLASRFGASIIARREGPEWMRKRGWEEVDWALDRDAWEASRRAGIIARRRPI
jgi:[ribosomal protein S5]-alanine N-acetyltransferase